MLAIASPITHQRLTCRNIARVAMPLLSYSNAPRAYSPANAPTAIATAIIPARMGTEDDGTIAVPTTVSAMYYVTIRRMRKIESHAVAISSAG